MLGLAAHCEVEEPPTVCSKVEDAYGLQMQWTQAGVSETDVSRGDCVAAGLIRADFGIPADTFLQFRCGDRVDSANHRFWSAALPDIRDLPVGTVIDQTPGSYVEYPFPCAPEACVCRTELMETPGTLRVEVIASAGGSAPHPLHVSDDFAKTLRFTFESAAPTTGTTNDDMLCEQAVDSYRLEATIDFGADALQFREDGECWRINE